MFRTLLLLPLCFLGCASTETVNIPPLPVGEGGIAYADLMVRLRTHSTQAIEAYYRDEWESVAGAGRMIEQTASFLPRATQIPAHLMKRVGEEAERMTASAHALTLAGERADAKAIHETLSRIQFQIRTLQASK